jgi:hypothetical protein
LHLSFKSDFFQICKHYGTAIAFKIIMHTANANIEMQGFDGPKSPTVARTMPVAVVMLAAMMIGTPCGILMADRDILPFLKQNIASQLASVRNYLLVNADTAGAKPETSEVIMTGLASIVAIHYSSRTDSAHVAFDLESMDLVRTERLRGPDRIYFDLQDRSREQGIVRRMKTKKAVSIAGSLLTRVRIARRNPGTTRIVLDLKRSCDYTYQTLSGPHSRLMVEIRPRPNSASFSK